MGTDYILKISDVQNMAAMINRDLGSFPGASFFGEDEDINCFDNLWQTGQSFFAIYILVGTPDLDICDYESLEEYISNLY